MYKVRKINFGWYHRKHGILLENLPLNKQKLLTENDYLKWMESDPQVFEIIFKIEDSNSHFRSLKKTYWNPYTDDFTTYKEVEADADLMDWACAICDTDIKCRIGYRKVENFVCKKCSESHNSKNKLIDRRIIDSTNKFTKHCKTLFKKEQREFITHIRRDSKS